MGSVDAAGEIGWKPEPEIEIVSVVGEIRGVLASLSTHVSVPFRSHHWIVPGKCPVCGTEALLPPDRFKNYVLTRRCKAYQLVSRTNITSTAGRSD